jgi:glucokinase
VPGRDSPPALVADIGGTNIRLALVGPAGEPSHIMKLQCADFLDPAAAVDAYIDRVPAAARPLAAAFAVASPVAGDRIEMTNHPWSFSIAALQQRLGFDRLAVVNDFTAIALAVPRLKPNDMRKIGGGKAVDGQAIGHCCAGAWNTPRPNASSPGKVWSISTPPSLRWTAVRPNH